MIVSSDIHSLITSLSKTEKTYFKKHASLFIRENGNRYLHLFNAIAKQKEYDEAKLIKLFKGERFIKQFSVAKNYLYHRILEAMSAYHNSPAAEMQNMLNSSDFLFEKGLYNQADKLFRQAEKFGTKHELHLSLITLHLHAFEHHLKRREPEISIQKIQKTKGEIAVLKNFMTYSELLAKAQHLYNQYGSSRDPKYIIAFKKLIQDPFLKNEKLALTFNSKRRYYDIHAVYNNVIGNEKKAFQYSEKIISLFDSHPEKIKQDPIRYAGYINNTLLFANFLRKYNEIEFYLEKLEGISPILKTPYQEARFFEIYTNNYLNLYNSTGRFFISKKMVADLTKELSIHIKRLSAIDKLLLYGNIAYTYFGSENYKNCIVWINKLRTEVPLNVRPDLDSDMRMMNIIAHYELGNMEIIPDLIVSYYRFLKKRSSNSRTEKLIIAFLKKLFSIPSERKLMEALPELKKQFLRSGADPSEGFFDIVSWMESKIEKRKFAAIVRDKMKKDLT